jgi:hypothetical protein
VNVGIYSYTFLDVAKYGNNELCYSSRKVCSFKCLLSFTRSIQDSHGYDVEILIHIKTSFLFSHLLYIKIYDELTMAAAFCTKKKKYTTFLLNGKKTVTIVKKTGKQWITDKINCLISSNYVILD